MRTCASRAMRGSSKIGSEVLMMVLFFFFFFFSVKDTSISNARSLTKNPKLSHWNQREDTWKIMTSYWQAKQV